MTLKQRLGNCLIPKLSINHHVSNHIRHELAALWVRIMHIFHPRYRAKIENLRNKRDLLVNIGCGPFGKPNWVNLDLYTHPHLTLRTDTRRELPLADDSCIGIHVEHFLEHLNPVDERMPFLHECRRCLQPDGILRVITPDADLYIRAHLEPGWEHLNRIGCGEDKPEAVFRTKMEALNHVFLQEWAHFGGYDAETLEHILKEVGFTQVNRSSWRTGEFPGGCIDREQHRPYSLYFEAKP